MGVLPRPRPQQPDGVPRARGGDLGLDLVLYEGLVPLLVRGVFEGELEEVGLGLEVAPELVDVSVEDLLDGVVQGLGWLAGGGRRGAGAEGGHIVPGALVGTHPLDGEFKGRLRATKHLDPDVALGGALQDGIGGDCIIAAPLADPVGGVQSSLDGVEVGVARRFGPLGGRQGGVGGGVGEVALAEGGGRGGGVGHSMR